MPTGNVFIIPLLRAAGADDPKDSSQSNEIVDLQRQVGSLRQEQAELRRIITEVRDILIGKRPKLENVFVAPTGPTIGRKDASVVLVEFTDFDCPFCRDYVRSVFPQIRSEYIETGKLLYVSRQFPLENSHPTARFHANAALCANDQGKYWEMHEHIGLNDKQVPRMQLPDSAKFEGCVEGMRHSETISRDLDDGRQLGVSGTPTFFIGIRDAAHNGQVRALRSMVGVTPFTEFQKAIEEALALSAERSK